MKALLKPSKASASKGGPRRTVQVFHHSAARIESPTSIPNVRNPQSLLPDAHATVRIAAGTTSGKASWGK